MTKYFSPQLAPWLFAPDIQALLTALNQEGGGARVVGGAVRNTLLGVPIDDIDIATTWKPQEIMRRAQATGFRSVPTGIDFGTVTVIVNHRPFEVTSLREDIKSDGRHAVVAFGEDWHRDAQRRDFTMNALYCDAQGMIYDVVGGLEDVKARHIRFIGAAHQRIEEDYLRILRFFRFFAYYGEGRPEQEAMRAIVRQREGLKNLSAERIWGELKKLLQAPDPHRALLWMRQSGVLSLILPESEKWGIDLIPGLIKAEGICDFPPDSLLRLMSMIPPDRERINALARRLKLAAREKKRLMNWAMLAPIAPDISTRDLRKILYQTDKEAVQDKIKLALASYIPNMNQKSGFEFDSYQKKLLEVRDWRRPHFPLNGHDLMAYGYKGGAELGKLLASLEADWVMSDFRLTKAELLAKLL